MSGRRASDFGFPIRRSAPLCAFAPLRLAFFPLLTQRRRVCPLLPYSTIRNPQSAMGRFAAIVSLVLLLGGQGTTHAAEEKLASEVELSGPRGVFVDNEGTILVASRGNNRIILFKNRDDLGLERESWPFSLVPFGVIEGTKSPRLKAPCDVAVDSIGRVLVADTGNHAVKIYDPPISDPRARTRIIGRGLVRQFSSPEGVAVDEQNNMIISDTGNGKVKILSPEGKLQCVIPSGKEIVETASSRFQTKRQDAASTAKAGPLLKAPIAACYLGKGYLAIADRAVARSTFSLWRYKPVSPSSGPAEFKGYALPALPPTAGFNFHIRDIAYHRQSGTFAYIGSNLPLKSAAFLYFRAVDPDDPAKLVQPEPDPSSWQRVSLVGWVKDPAGLAFSPKGNLYITDAASSSVQKISRESLEHLNTPVSVRAERTRATLRYFSTALTPTLFQYGAMPGYVGRSDSFDLPRQYEDPAEVEGHTAHLPDLLPSTRYAYRYLLSEDFFCAESGKLVRNFSGTMCFATQPAPHTIAYLDFPFSVILFTNVVERAAEPLPDDPGPLSEQEIRDFRSQLDKARLFFWVNSRMTCNIRPTLTVFPDRLDAPLFPRIKSGAEETPRLKEFLSALDNLLVRVRERTGRDHTSSRNIFIIRAVRSYDPKLRRYVRRASPGMTCGLTRMGGAVSILSYTDDTTWSFITECQRRLSIMHLASGREDNLRSLLKDPDLDQSMVSWDSPADLLRALGRQSWLSNRYGIFKVTADADDDGIPDDEPQCPRDEKRFGTSPRAKDTDRDGVSDLNEILTSRWASGFPIISFRIDGTRETTRAIQNHATPSLSAADSDADGVLDPDDRNPLCPLNDFIPKLNVTLDGEIKSGEWENASSMRIVDPAFTGVLRAAWSETHLCFCLVGGGAEIPPSIRLRLDGTADGFLRGSDNLSLVLDLDPSDASFKVRNPKSEIRNLQSQRASPNPQSAIRNPQSEGAVPNPQSPIRNPQSAIRNAVVAKWSVDKNKDAFQIEIGLPKSPDLGLNLVPGEEIGFDFELRPAKSRRPLPKAESAIRNPQSEGAVPNPQSAIRNPQSAMDSLWLRVFEPLTLFRGILVQPSKDIEMPD